MQHLQFLGDQGLPYSLFDTYLRERHTATAKVYVDTNVDVHAVYIAELKEVFNPYLRGYVSQVPNCGTWLPGATVKAAYTLHK